MATRSGTPVPHHHTRGLMATLTAWRFDTPEGADAAEQTLIALSKDELIEVHDAATVSWPAGQEAEDPAARRPHRRRRWAVRSGACSSASCSSYRCWHGSGRVGRGARRVPHRCRHRRRVHPVGARPGDTWYVGALRPVERRGFCARGRPSRLRSVRASVRGPGLRRFLSSKTSGPRSCDAPGRGARD